MRKGQDFVARVVYVIIPAYNCQKYLEDSVVSVLAQTSINAQVVIVDDGSTDETAQVIDSIADGNEKVHILHKENGGDTYERKKGKQKVKTKKKE